MSLFASLMALTRLDNDDIGDVVSQAVKGEYWPCLSRHLVSCRAALVLVFCHYLIGSFKLFIAIYSRLIVSALETRTLCC